MTSPTPSAEMDDPNVREDIAGCCDAWAEASDRCGLPKRAAAMRDLALELRRPSDPVRAELETTADDAKLAYQIMIALGESPDVAGSLEPGANRRVDIVARVLAARRPTSTRREVLEEAIQAVKMSAWKHVGDDAHSQGMDVGAMHQIKVCLEALRSLASEGE